MYSKGNGRHSKHEWVTRVENLGAASYVYVRQFIPFAGDPVFNSLSCPQLSAPTFIQIPRAFSSRFSLGSFSVTRGTSIPVNGFKFERVSLCPAAATLFTILTSYRVVLSTFVKVSKALMTSRDIHNRLLTLGVDLNPSPITSSYTLLYSSSLYHSSCSFISSTCRNACDRRIPQF